MLFTIRRRSHVSLFLARVGRTCTLDRRVNHQVSATPLKLLIQQIHPHVRVERDSGMCVARDLYELWGQSLYTRMFVARTSH